MHLFYKPGACSMAAHIILNEASATYTTDKVDTEKGVTEAGLSYADVNPRGYVPALRLESGDVITENVALLQYLGDQFADLAFVPPAGSFERVRLQEMLSFLASELHKAFSPFFSGRDLTAEEKEAATRLLHKKIAQFDGMMPANAPFLLGDKFSVADAYAFVILNWTNFIGVSIEDRPKLAAYLAKIGARPAVQQTLQQEGLAA